MRAFILLAAALLSSSFSGLPAQQPPGAAHEGQAFTFHRISDDIYHAVGTGSMVVGANAAVVIHATDILLVDSHISPAAAWVLFDELKAISVKPVRYVVNTHFHFDHLHGNQIYPPDVEIIGHEFTREMVLAGRSKAGRAYEGSIGMLPQQIAALTQTDRYHARSHPPRRAGTAANYPAQLSRGHPGRDPHAPHHHIVSSHDPVSRRPGGPPAVLRSRAHRW